MHLYPREQYKSKTVKLHLCCRLITKPRSLVCKTGLPLLPLHAILCNLTVWGCFIMVTDMFSIWVSSKQQNTPVPAATSGEKAGNMLSFPQINYLLKSQQQLVCWFEFYPQYKHRKKKRLQKQKAAMVKWRFGCHLLGQDLPLTLQHTHGCDWKPMALRKIWLLSKHKKEASFLKNLSSTVYLGLSHHH